MMCHDGKFTTNVAERECGVPNLLEADLQQNLETLYSQGHCHDHTLVYRSSSIIYKQVICIACKLQERQLIVMCCRTPSSRPTSPC